MNIHVNFICLLILLVSSKTIAQSKNDKTMNFNAITINLIVNNVNESVDFYKDVLDFQTTMTVPESGSLDFAMIQKNQVTIMLQSLAGFSKEFPQYANTQVGGTIMLYIEMTDLEILYNKIKQEEIDLFVDLNTTFYGTKEFSIKDNDGYILVFAEKKE